MSVLTCNACNEKFAEEAEQREHYRTEWHRYNLKRKVANLPGVTAVWFERRREAAAAQSAAQERLLYKCTLCRKEYTTPKAHANHLQSRAHLGKAASVPGGAPPEPVVRAAPARPTPPGAQASAGPTPKLTTGHDPGELTPHHSQGEVIRGENEKGSGATNGRNGVMKPIVSGSVRESNSEDLSVSVSEDSEDEDEEEGDWEEVSDTEAAALLAEGAERARASREDMEEEEEEDMEDGDGVGGTAMEEEDGEEWDVAQCLFCGKRAKRGDMAACVEHMHRRHGFFIPDAEYLARPEDLLRYLALKVNKACMCLYCDERGKQFESVEAVQRHMVDRNHCKLRWGDGSGVAEEELEEFYDFSASYGGAENMQVMLSEEGMDAPVALGAGGLELIIRGTGDGRSERVIGSREMARFYKQRPRPSEQRDSVLVGTLVARYKSMGLATRQPHWMGKKGKQLDSGVKASQRAEAIRTRVGLKNNIIRKLPKNVPH